MNLMQLNDRMVPLAAPEVRGSIPVKALGGPFKGALKRA